MKASMEINQDGSADCLNFFPDAKSCVRTLQYKTIKGLCHQIKRADKNCKKYGWKTRIEFTLPI